MRRFPYRLLAILVPTLAAVVLHGADSDAANAALFRKLDVSGTGRLGINEFLAGFSSSGKPLESQRELRLRDQFKRMDSDGDQKLSRDEFVAFFHKSSVSGPVTKNPAPVPVVVKAPVAKPAVKTKTPVDEDEADVIDPNIANKITLNPWTENQRRSTENVFLPSATTIRKGGFHWRVVHVAREVVYEDTTTNLLGMDDSVKLGLQVGYGISERLDVTLQRSNGRTLQVGTTGKPVNMDYWDMLFKYKLLDQNDGAKDSGGLADIAVVAGTTYMLRNHTKSKASLDLQVVAERNFFSDRLRLGIGLAYAGLSTYEAIPGLGSATKLFPDEYDALANPSFDRPENRSAAIPFTCKIALSERWQLFSEMVVPVAGWRTHDGPATAAGLRFNTHTHEYSFYFSNTANTAFNGVVTGGADRWSNLPVFGFNIIGHL